MTGGMIAVMTITGFLAGCGSDAGEQAQALGDDVLDAWDAAIDKGKEAGDYIFGTDGTKSETQNQVKTVDLLPILPESLVTRHVNPEVPEVDGVAGLFFQGAEATGNLPSVTTFLSRLETFGQGLTCAYENDQLAIGAYIDTEYWYSVGLVAVAREPDGWTDAGNELLDLGWCWARERFFAMAQGAPVIQGCLEHREQVMAGETYHVVIVGSTNWMCAELSGRPSDRSTVPGAKNVEPFSGWELVPQAPIQLDQQPLAIEGD